MTTFVKIDIVQSPSLLAMTVLLASCATSRDPSSSAAGNTSGNHPLGTGSVEFVDFSSAELADIRVIPEEGTALFVPKSDQRIEDVDGFWWRKSQQWFKIPDHCHATVKQTPGGLLLSEPDCSEIGTRAQKLRGGLATPAWQNDHGNTAHGTDYPF